MKFAAWSIETLAKLAGELEQENLQLKDLIKQLTVERKEALESVRSLLRDSSVILNRQDSNQ